MNYARIAVLDVDGVLAPHGEPISKRTRDLLRQIHNYSKIALASGKPAPYLEGLARGMGLTKTIIIGENGGVIYIPQEMSEIIFQDVDRRELTHFKLDLDKRFNNAIRYQQNMINITIFPNTSISVTEIGDECRKILRHYNFEKDLKLYIHVDSIDVVPRELDKQWAIDRISIALKIPLSRFIAVGDGINDIGMLSYVKSHNGTSISVGKDPDVKRSAQINFDTGLEALNYILIELEKSSGSLAQKTKDERSESDALALG